jgi:adenylylsulfate kinase
MRSNCDGDVIWITGLSGAGKSSLATAVTKHLRSSATPVVFLDGDELRSLFCATSENHYDREERVNLAMKYSQLCKLISSQGNTVVIATISMFKEIHQWNRVHLPGYFEVFLDVPFDILRSRDPLGIYKRFDVGELFNVAGLDLAVDRPETPDLKWVFNPSTSVETLSTDIITAIEAKKNNV